MTRRLSEHTQEPVRLHLRQEIQQYALTQALRSHAHGSTCQPDGSAESVETLRPLV